MRVLWHILTLLPFVISQVAAQTLTNVTVDEDNSSIVYAGDWTRLPPGSRPSLTLDIGGTRTFSNDPGASARFSFTGMSARRPEGSPTQDLS